MDERDRQGAQLASVFTYLHRNRHLKIPMLKGVLESRRPFEVLVEKQDRVTLLRLFFMMQFYLGEWGGILAANP